MKTDFNSITATDIWGEYNDSQSYLENTGLFTNIPTFVRYFEGKQWPRATEKTKNLPRPVVNIIKFISRNIKSGIVNTPVKVIFTAEDGQQTSHLNDWHEYIEGELKMRTIDRKAVTQGVKKGTYVYHYYWDNNKRGKDALTPGGVNVEIIDVLSFRVANPRETDEQKQKWIMIISRVELDAVREMARMSGTNPDNILADESDSAYQEEEQDGTDYVTVITKYYKVNGEVYFMKSTKDVIFQTATKLQPNVKAELEKIQGTKPDAQETSLPEGEMQDNPTNEDIFDMYPVVVGNIEERENSIYGIGLVEDMIENQNIINRDLAYYQKARRDMALGGWMKKKGALDQGQSITNSPDQVITDNTPGDSWGIAKLPAGNIPSDNLNFVDLFVNMIRTVTGATEVMSGEVLGKNMSGAAIAQLQSQAQLPLEDYRQRFWSVKEKQALVLMCFYKFFYSETSFNVKRKTGTKDEIEPVTFSPNEIKGKKFDVIATAGQGSQYNELSTISALDNLLAKSVITPKFYIQALPEKVLGNKEDLLKYFEEMEQGQIAQITQQNETMKNQLVQAAEMLSKQDETIKKAAQLVTENKRLNEQILTMATEYMQTLTAAKVAIEKVGQEATTAKGDAALFAQELQKYIKMTMPEPKGETEV